MVVKVEEVVRIITIIITIATPITIMFILFLLSSLQILHSTPGTQPPPLTYELMPDLDRFLPPPVIIPDPGPVPQHTTNIPDYVTLSLFRGILDGTASMLSASFGWHINGQGPFQLLH